MSGVGPVSGADVKTQNLQTKSVARVKQEAVKEPEDKVDIQKKEISKTRNIIEKVIGSPVGLVTMAGNTVGGIFGGGFSGATADKDDAAGPQGLTTAAAYIGMGVTAGLMLAGGWIPAVVGGVAGLGLGVLSIASNSSDKIADKVGEKAVKATSDNQPSDSKVRDTVMNFTEGGIVGGVYGGVEGLKHGTTYGAGIVSGAIEGTKGMVGSLAGTYEKKAEAEEKPAQQKSFINRLGSAIASVPRKLTRFIAGTVTGAAGGALGAADGLIQGTTLGVDKGEDASRNAHNVIKGLQIIGAGALAGAMFAGGGWMIAAGAGAGVIGAGLMGAISKGTGADRKFAKGLTDAVRHAEKDNTYQNKADEYGDRDTTVYESFRDGIEGALTGTGAGIREGVKEGYQQGAGVVDGVFDAGKGIVKGLAGGVSGAIKDAPKAETEEAAEAAKPQENQADKPKKNFVQKLIQFPGKVIKGVVGGAIGVASAPLHIIPGAVKGLHEGMRGDSEYGDGNMVPFHTAMFIQNVGAAAAAGFMIGGPATAALAGGGALLFTGLTTFMGERTGVYDELSEKTEAKVKNALSDNEGTKTAVAFQNATEGTIVGAATSVGKGFSVGYDSGSGAVSGVVDLLEGGMEGIYQVGKNAVNKVRGK